MIKEIVEEQNERQVNMNQKELTHQNERKANMKKMNLLKTQKGFTLLVKPFRSDMDSPVSPSAQSGSQSSQTKCRNYVAHSYGFTLAETLITLTILGVVAAITVPSLINKQIESANRTKVKKAMAVYEKALNQMIIDQDAKGSLKDVNGFKTTDTCSESTKYFKKVQETTPCKFKTADRVWWDITDIEKPIIAFNESDLLEATAADATTNKAFYLIGRRADGILRINDKGFEDSQDSTTNATNIAAMTKLYNFINKVETTSGVVTPTTPSECTESPCNINGVNFTQKTGNGQCITLRFGPLVGQEQCGLSTTQTAWATTPISAGTLRPNAKKDICYYYEDDECLSSDKDLYDAANDYCNNIGTGVHLATMGELISLGYTDDNLYMSSDISDPYSFYVLGYGEDGNGNKSDDQFKVVCVGN